MQGARWRTRLIAGLVAGLLYSGAAAGECDDMDVSGLQGRWTLESIDGKPVDAPTPIYFEIDGLTITGFDGCNNFGGRLDQPAGLRKSQRACLAEGPRLPLDFSDPWAHLERATVSNNTLVLPLPEGSGHARLHRE